MGRKPSKEIRKEMRYVCPICDVGKRSIGDMKSHIKVAHEEVDYKIKWIYEQ